MREGEEKGLLWKLPELKSKHLNWKFGPSFGVGSGCGLGFGLGILGGAGIGPGIPGLQVGFGFGVGCGVGLGFGYGIGVGIARDDKRTYSNVRKHFRGLGNQPSEDVDIGALVDELVTNTKKLISETSKEIEKWRR